MNANYGDEEMRGPRRRRNPLAPPRPPGAPSLMNAPPSLMSSFLGTPGKGAGVQVKPVSFNAPPSQQAIKYHQQAGAPRRSRPQNITHPMQALAGFTQDAVAAYHRGRAAQKERQRKEFFTNLAGQFGAPQGVDPDLWKGIVADRPEAAVQFLFESEQAAHQSRLDAQQAATKRQQDLEDYRHRKDIDREYAEPKARTKTKAADGLWRWDDTGERVFKGIEKAPEAPTVKKVLLPDGSEAAVQWDPNNPGHDGQPGAWVPIDAPQGGRGLTPKDKLTESQSKLTLFRSMQSETQPFLLEMEKRWNPANIQDAAARSLPIGEAFFQTQEGQMYSAAASAWAEGALRIATGAAATPEEMKRTIKTYFASPGDTPTTVAFKAELRNMYDRSIQRGLGGRDVEGSLPLPSAFAESVLSDKGNGELAPQAPEGFPESQDIWDQLTPEERRLWAN